MDIEKLADRLAYYNEWRRGLDGKQPHPVELGADIDEAVSTLREIARLRAEVEALKGPGYVRVPVEPTAEMIRKGQGQWSGESMVEIYKAMLAAATQETSHD